MGDARRERERPDLNPENTAEFLWYRGLVARAFFDTPGGPEEFAYVPDDLLPLIPVSAKSEQLVLGRAARPEEYRQKRPASDRILDNAATLLAGRRIGLKEEKLEEADEWVLPVETLTSLLNSAGMLDKQGKPRAEAARVFLESGRADALHQFARAWLESSAHNDLRLMPGLEAEGGWQNDPLAARTKVIALLQNVPVGQWWGLDAFVEAVKQHEPDFQRPGGDYDSWYLRDEETGAYLRGFDHWEQVDGALLRYLITGPLHWLGLLDLAAANPDGEPAAFRLTQRLNALLEDKPPEVSAKEESKLIIDAKNLIHAPRAAPRAARYQLARFCQWLPPHRDEYRYRITPPSLARAEKQGLKSAQLLALFERHAEKPLPPNLTKAISQWAQHGAQARIAPVTVLRLASPDLLKKLRASRAARFLGDPLGPTAVIVKPGAAEKVLEALAEMGFLGEIVEPED
jgi:hypothetical protein